MQIKVGFIGHSYIRDICSLGVSEIEVDNFNIHFKYFYKPGGNLRNITHGDIFVKSLLEYKPEIVFLFIGGNDLRLDFPLKETIYLYKEFFHFLKSKLPSSVFICSTVEPRFAPANERFCTLGPDVYKTLTHKFNRFMKKWDLPDRKFLTWGANRLENRELFKKDLVHLNERGLHLLWELMEDLVVRVVKEKFSNK